MVLKNLCVLVLWTKVSSVLEGLSSQLQPSNSYHKYMGIHLHNPGISQLYPRNSWIFPDSIGIKENTYVPMQHGISVKSDLLFFPDKLRNSLNINAYIVSFHLNSTRSLF